MSNSNNPETAVLRALVLSRRIVATLALAGGLLAVISSAAPISAVADDKDVANALRAGGLVIVVRHGATFPDQADTDPLHPDNIAAQRNLNDKGKALAKSFGDGLRQIGAPIGKVYTSLFNRAYETAVLAGFTDIEKTADLTEGGLVVSPNENNRARRSFAQDARRRTEGRYGHGHHHAQAEHHRRAR